jgi:drug/metabolite transporter (DMT)-like permease
VGSLPTGFIRLLIASGFLAMHGYLFRGRPWPSDASAEAWWWLGWSGFFGFFLADLFMFRALLLIGPRLTLLIQSLAPPSTALIAWALLNERLALLDWMGMALTLAGVSWVILRRTPTPAGKSLPVNLRAGVPLAVGAAICQALGFVFSKEGIADYDVMAGTFIRVIVGIAGFAFFITLTRRWSFVLAAARHRRAMAMALWGSFVGPFLGVSLSLVALQHCHAGVAATIISTTPVLILPFVIVVYGEHVSWRAAVGAVISVVGVALLLL